MQYGHARGWRDDWVLALDIQGFWDTIAHELRLRAVQQHTDSPGVLVCIERWLKAPGQMPDGTLVAREQGTPHGGVASPLLANRCWHDTCAGGMPRNHPELPYER